ncbi:MAG: 4Fe-4S binding protein, partial [Rhodocyclaceae bacterium]|nr:4Fe-4S binding protein [Rhodocyclaceae bacterium]
MSQLPSRPGAEAVAARGWLAAHKWLLLRRLSQVAILLLFLVGPWFKVWIVKGNLSYSYTLDFLPLADPYLLLQMLLAGQTPEKLAWIGVAIVLVFYLLVGGRSYCAWVCPVNLLTDLAHWLRARLGLKGGAHLGRTTRYWMLGMTLAVAGLTGSIAWEMV